MAENKGKNNNLYEVSQYYTPNQENSFYFPAKKLITDKIKGLVGGQKNFQNLLQKINIEAASLFLEMAEDAVDETVFVKHRHDMHLTDVTKELGFAQKLVADGIIDGIGYSINFNDEPKVFTFTAAYGGLLKKISDSGGPVDGVASGSSVTSRNEALMKCLCEAIERTCGAYFKKKDFITASYEELKKKGLNALDPRSFAGFSEKQIQEKKYLKDRRVTADSVLGWVWGKSLITGEKIFVPAQLVYVPYKYERNEAVIRLPLTTGAAIYTEENEAMYRGLCEAVERDAFMIHYLNKLSPPIVDLENSLRGEFKPLLKTFKKYNLEIRVLDITTDIAIPTFTTLAIDRTGIGPAVSVGNKADFDVKNAIKGSIEEALKIRQWARQQLITSPEVMKEARNNPDKIDTLGKRCLFWAPLNAIGEIEFFLRGPRKIINDIEKTPESGKEKLKKALEYFKANSEVVAVDTTIPEIKKYGFHSRMMLSPELHHLHLWEGFKCLGGRRLYETPVKLGYFDKPKKEEELNPTPHPFP